MSMKQDGINLSYFVGKKQRLIRLTMFRKYYTKFLLSVPRGLGGKTVKDRCGTAAVTGDDPLMNPLRGKCRSGRQGRERTGSQKTCRQECVVFFRNLPSSFRNRGCVRTGRPPRSQGHARNNASGSKTAFRDSSNGSRFFCLSQSRFHRSRIQQGRADR